MTIELREKRKNSANSQEKTLTLYEKINSAYEVGMPGALGFLTLANPMACVADSVLKVPAENGLATRMVVTAASLGGLQHVVSATRRHLYDSMNIYWMSERAKRIFDSAYGAVVGGLFNPCFHWLTKKMLHLQQTVPIEDAVVTGMAVGAATGLVSWLASDAYAHSWGVENTPSREIKIPGADYLKNLPSSIKKKLAIGTTILSLAGTAAFYTHSHYTTETANMYRGKPQIEVYTPVRQSSNYLSVKGNGFN